MILLSIVVVYLLLVVKGLWIEQEYQRSIVFRLGYFSGKKDSGIYWIIPYIEQ